MYFVCNYIELIWGPSVEFKAAFFKEKSENSLLTQITGIHISRRTIMCILWFVQISV